MNINLSKDSLCIIIDGLCLLQKEKTKQYSQVLSTFKNPHDIAVCIAKEELLNVSYLLGLVFKEIANEKTSL